MKLRNALCINLFWLLFLIFSTAESYAEDSLVLKSSTKQTAIIELYTSEGCSSCPPADRWLGQLKTSNSLWSQFVPLAFHVDYWNYLGWKDKYAKDSFSQRQYRYKQLNQVSEVYTPGMFLNGHEWQQWRRTSVSILESALAVKHRQDIGVLELHYSTSGSTITFTPDQTLDKKPDYFYLALLGSNITSHVKAGENGGKRLHHDFVVLDLVQASAKLNNVSYTAQLQPFNTDLSAPKYAIAAWVSYDNDSKPLQAVGGWLNNLAD